MTIPKRFALSTLLQLMLVVASVFGFLQWRRQRIIGDVKWLNEANGRLTVGEGVAVEGFNTLPTIVVRGGIFPKVQVVTDTVITMKSGRIAIAGGIVPVRFVKRDRDNYQLSDTRESYSLAELKEQLREIENRLAAIGLTAVAFCEHRGGAFFSTCNETVSVDEIGE